MSNQQGWMKLYAAAPLETDPARLQDEIDQAEPAIHARWGAPLLVLWREVGYTFATHTGKAY